MSDKSRKTPETEAEKTTPASAVELEEEELEKASGGAAFAKYDGIVADKYIDKVTTDVLLEGEAYIDKSAPDIVSTIRKPTSR